MNTNRMILRTCLILLAAVISTEPAACQTKIFLNRTPYDGDVGIELILGEHGFNGMITELGMGINLAEIPDQKSNRLIKPYLGGSYTFLIMPHDADYFGQSINIWLGGTYCIGGVFNIINYANEKTWSLKPYAGIGIWRFNLVYGYNFALKKHEIPCFNRHEVSLRFFFPLVIFDDYE